MKPIFHLRNWDIINHFYGDTLTGIIQENHTNGRGIKAGERIYTTPIIARDGNKFETINSIYLVEGD